MRYRFESYANPNTKCKIQNTNLMSLQIYDARTRGKSMIHALRIILFNGFRIYVLLIIFIHLCNIHVFFLLLHGSSITASSLWLRFLLVQGWISSDFEWMIYIRVCFVSLLLHSSLVSNDTSPAMEGRTIIIQ
eukprot:1049492_1